MKKAKRFLSKTLKIGIYLSFLFITSLCLLEIAYRYQIIDFYKNELEALNPNLNKEYPNGNVLVFGDSFSAFSKGYIDQLRITYPKTNFINTSISGIGIRQHRLFFKDRIEKFDPKQILYQFYVGNDLLDIKKDLNPSKISYLRTYYYFISDQFLVLKYINSKLARFKSIPTQFSSVENSTIYNPRIKQQFLANPDYLNETISVSGKQKEKFEKWLELYSEISASTEVKMTLLVLPHCAQVSKKYADKMNALGAIANPNLQDSSFALVDKIEAKYNLFNPLRVFQKADKSSPIYYKNDPHLNERGQSILAQFLIEKKIFSED
jgi:hypothetical protein